MMTQPRRFQLAVYATDTLVFRPRRPTEHDRSLTFQPVLPASNDASEVPGRSCMLADAYLWLIVTFNCIV